MAVRVTESGSMLAGSPPTSVAFSAGDSSATLRVPTAGDRVAEADSILTATVTAGDGYAVGPAASASVSVADDDAASFTVSASPPAIDEGGTATLRVSIANGVTFAQDQTIALAVTGTASAADHRGVARRVDAVGGTVLGDCGTDGDGGSGGRSGRDGDRHGVARGCLGRRGDADDPVGVGRRDARCAEPVGYRHRHVLGSDHGVHGVGWPRHIEYHGDGGPESRGGERLDRAGAAGEPGGGDQRDSGDGHGGRRNDDPHVHGDGDAGRCCRRCRSRRSRSA